MYSLSPSKKLTGVHVFLYSAMAMLLTAPAVSVADTTNSNSQPNGYSSFDNCMARPGATEASCLELMGKLNAINGGTGTCDSHKESFKTGALSEWNKCKSLVGTINYCNQKKVDLGESEEGDNATDTSQCQDALPADCAYMSPSSMQDLKSSFSDSSSAHKDADSALNDAQTQVDQLNQSLSTALLNRSEAQKAADKSYRDKVQQLETNFKNSISDADAAEKKAYSDAINQFDAIDQQYIMLRDQLRRAKTKILTAQAQLVVICKASASKKYRDAEDVLNKRIDAENSYVKTHGFSSLASYSHIQNRKVHNLKKTDYANFYNDCMSNDGSDPDGAAQRAAILQAQNDEKDDEANLADKQAELEKQRAQILQQLKDIDASTAKNKADVQTQAQQLAANLQQDYVAAYKDANDTFLQAYQSATQNLQTAQKNLLNAGQDADHASKQYMADYTALQCAQSGGLTIANSTDDFKQKYKDCDDAEASFRSACGDLASQCGITGYDPDSDKVAPPISDCSDTAIKKVIQNWTPKDKDDDGVQ